MKNKIVIYGMGQLYKRYESLIDITEVECYVDNNSIEKTYNNRPVVKVGQLEQFQYDYVVVFTIKNFDDIAYDLVWNHGVDINKIVIFQWYYNLNYNTKRIYNAFTSLLDKTNIKYILDINNCLSKLDLWAIYKKSSVCIDEKCIDKHYYDITLIDANDYCLENLNNEVNRILSKSKSILIHIHNCDMLKKVRYKVINIQGYIFLYVTCVPQKIQIYQIGHKPFIKYGDDLYIKLGVGNYDEKGLLTDKNGDNISTLNDKVNEITGLYEIWKNRFSDIVGINHYRRCFKSIINPFYGALSELEIYLIINNTDIIVACSTGPDTYSEKNDLRNSINKDAFDRCWEKLNEYFSKKNRAEQKALMNVFDGQIMFPCNMIVTSREIYNEYCTWLMPIVFYLVDNVVFDTSWDTYSNRVIGFFAERLLTVWLYMKDYTITELPIQFIGEAGEFGK